MLTLERVNYLMFHGWVIENPTEFSNITLSEFKLRYGQGYGVSIHICGHT